MLREQLKETFLIGTLRIGLPTVDSYSDCALMYTLYRGHPYHPDCDIRDKDDKLATVNETCLAGIPTEQMEYENHPTWATLLLVPFLMNYIAAWCFWYKIDSRKRFTWIACALGLYAQLRAANIIREVWKDLKRGLALKRKFDREFSEFEVFLEAIPTTFIITYLRARFNNPHNKRVKLALRGSTYSNTRVLFVISYLSSIISASIGMAKVLKVKVQTDCKYKSVAGRGLQGAWRRWTTQRIPFPPIPPHLPCLPAHTVQQGWYICQPCEHSRKHKLCCNLNICFPLSHSARFDHWNSFHLAPQPFQNLSQSPLSFALANVLILHI